MAGLHDITIRHETRLCKVDDRLGYFHCWSHEAYPIAPGITIGSHPGGQSSTTVGIVEFSDKVEYVQPDKIHFVDEQNAMLNEMNNNMKGKTCTGNCDGSCENFDCLNTPDEEE